MRDSQSLSLRQKQAIETLEALLDDCSQTVRDAESSVPALARRNVATGTLLQRCEELAKGQVQEPVRIVHHFACTGGTLISKCLSVMPNTLLLSEVDPFSKLPFRRSNFAPTDLIRQITTSGRPFGPELTADIFLAGFDAARAHCQKRGTRIVLRDHTHSQFCVGDTVRDEPSMASLLGANYPLLSVVTVRHPLDSYLSLLNNDWVHYTPRTLEEYARRYLAFLDAYAGVPIYRYEAFVRDPLIITRRLCDELDLAFSAEAFEYFSAMTLTGDSGRRSGEISPRERRPIPGEVQEELAAAPAFRALCNRLGYEYPDLAERAPPQAKGQ